MTTRAKVRQEAGNTAINRIKFALRLAGADLNTFRPGDWLNLVDDVSQFLGITARTEHEIDTTDSARSAKAQMLKENRGKPLLHKVLPGPIKGAVTQTDGEALPISDSEFVLAAPMGRSPGDYKPEDWERLQGDVNSILRGKSVELTSNESPSLKIGLGVGETVLCASGPTRDVFVLLLLLLLAREGTDNIAKCPECAKVFWRETRRQKYCSRHCAVRASVKAFHVRKKAAATNQESSKTQKERK